MYLEDEDNFRRYTNCIILVLVALPTQANEITSCGADEAGPVGATAAGCG